MIPRKTTRLWLTTFLVLTTGLAGCADDATSENTDSIDSGDSGEADVQDDLADTDGADGADGADGDTGYDCPNRPATTELPATLTVAVEAVGELVISTDPYAITVRGPDGEVILTSTSPGRGDGYGAIAWTSGGIYWENVLTGGYFRTTPELDPWRDGWEVVAATGDGSEIEVTLHPPADACEQGEITIHHTFSGSTIRVEASLQPDDPDSDLIASPRAWAAAFESPQDEAFVGFGGRFNRVDQRGVDVYSWPEEGGIGTGEGDEPGSNNPTPSGQAMAYYPVPFFLSTEGYGFWIDSTWWNEYNLATDHDDTWRIWHIGSAFAYEILLPVPNDDRPWQYHAIDQFTEHTGRPMIPPAWTLGPRRRINRGDMQDGIHELQAMRDLDLAITSADDSTHFLPRGSHTGRETELAEWTEFAGSLGFRVNAYYNAYFDAAEDNPLAETRDFGVDNDYFLMNADGEVSTAQMISGSFVTIYMVDFTSDDASSWYGSLLDWALDLGYSGWMYDFGEYVQPEVLASNGMTGEELHNLYPVLYQQAAHQHLEASEHAGDWLTFARSGYTGASQYSPMVWTGDPAASFESSDGLPSVVRAGINLGIAGVPNTGSDINGFHCVADTIRAADEELLVRWIQQGSMTINMQDQDACTGGNGRKPDIFTSTLARETWATYARLHTRLFPYLYSLTFDANATGAPAMRSLWLEHPDRPDLAGVDDAYYFGPALLIAPVVERGATTKTVDLPAGSYLHWWDHEVVAGAGEVTLDAPLDSMPILIREGHLIPMLDATIDTLTAEESADVVGREDVSDVYDLVGYLSEAAPSAEFALYDNTALAIDWTGDFVPPQDYLESTADAIGTCADCYLLEDLDDGLTRLRLNVAGSDEALRAGGFALSNDSSRDIRWDIFFYSESD